MEIELREEEEEERIRNGRTPDVEGKSTRDRKQGEVKGGKGGEKSGSLFFVDRPLGVAVSSQSGGLIRVRV